MSISRRAFLGAAALSVTPGLARGQFARTSPASVADADPLGFPAEPGFPAEHRPGPNQDFSARFDPWVEVIPRHLHHNVAEVQRLSGNRPILAVVKNNAYGLDLATVGRLLQDVPAIWGFAVVKSAEAFTLRAAGVSKPILLMGMFSPEEGLELARAGVHLSLFTPDAAERISPLTEALERPLDAHLYLDTGMGRMGMPHRAAPPWMAELGRHPNLKIRSVYTELGEDGAFDPVQLDRFRDLTDGARESGLELGPLHAAASNGVFHLADGHLDMVRPGIALFGSYPSRPQEERQMAELRSAVRLRARVVRVSRLERGDGVGYGRPWIADRPTWVATLPVGHTDGYPRKAVTGARVLINGGLFPVIGGVSASHSIVHLGDEQAARVGDIVTLMGPDDPAIEPSTMAETLDVSVYDLLMHLNPSLPRRLVQE